MPGLLLGDRAAAKWVRAGSETATIEATFQLVDETELAIEVRRLLEEQGLDDPDNPDRSLLSREVRLMDATSAASMAALSVCKF